MAPDHRRLIRPGKKIRPNLLRSTRVYFTKILPTNLGAYKPTFYKHLYITSEVKQYYEALLLSYRPRTECSISQLCNIDCTHSVPFNIPDDRSTRGLLAEAALKNNFQNHLYGQSVLTFAVRAVVECLNEH